MSISPLTKSMVLMSVMLLLAACKPSPQAVQPAPIESLRVAFTGQPQSTLIHVAQAQGFFTSQGLKIEPVMATFGKEALKAVLEGRADIGTVAETPIMFSVLQGSQIQIIANIESSSVNNGVIARKDAGIQRAGDLKGKRVGMTPGTTSDFFLDSLLTANGLARKDIQAVPLKPEEMAHALVSGQVDAVSTWNYPLTSIRRLLGESGTLLLDREIYTETFNLAATPSFVRAQPQAVQRFLQALIMSERFVRQSPEAAQVIMARATNNELSLVQEVWPAFNYRVGMDQTLLITLEDETRWAMKANLTDRKDMPDYAQLLYPDALKAARAATPP